MNIIDKILDNLDIFSNFIELRPKSALRKITNVLIICGYINVWLLLGIIWFITKDKK